ncbi:hypothetical protein N7G274_009965 [Stereocaulon virgatum]|uniref:Uncharacterized protein n=1 Tax=Stereocaulon virgatum TaxID=373712 RepID=A0ABR3ZX24_9LECA
MPNPSTSFSSPTNHEAHPSSRPPSPTAPPYSPITPTMSNTFPPTNPPTHTTNDQNPYPYAPPPLNSSLTSSPDPLHHAHPTIPRPRDQPPTQQLQYPHPQSQPHPQYRQQQLSTQDQHLHSHSHPPPRPQYPRTEQMYSLPPSKPISESENPDAIALRAAMSILQVQRQQALRDMRTLERQKNLALSDPEEFARGVAEGRVRSRGTAGILPTPSTTNDEVGDEAEERSEGEEEAVDGKERHVFGEIPSAQNVVRMPPVNWAQYHVVGESLDRLHEEQLLRPTVGVLGREEDLRSKEREGEGGGVCDCSAV